ncbi:tRNA:m(4)X modification enzyme TRM13 homolog [Diadema antillarum]|uniref:tRNA:m(4)X modification enzyme TRM13 homolog n=1 Tax=Diadema antillarum TaxID=105358 RepID=UPI003A86589F
MAECEKRKCNFFVTKRKRFCRLMPAKGENFCGEHLNHEKAAGDGMQNKDPSCLKRIPCPYDPHHTVATKHLDKHLKVCNSRPKEQPDYFVKGINAGTAEDMQDDIEALHLASFSLGELRDIIAKVEQVFADHVPPIKMKVLHHDIMRAELNKEENGISARKHLVQLDSLLGHMQRVGLLDPDLCFIEFGAGRGRLSQWVQQALEENASSAKFLLVERAAVRHKRDVFYQRGAEGPTYQRINMDIENLCLGKVPAICSDPSAPIVAYTKHLCGAATDLALRCLMETPAVSNGDALARTNGEARAPSAGNAEPAVAGDPAYETNRGCKTGDVITAHPLSAHCIKGVVMAMCCHHRCSWKSYVGREFLTRVGISSRDFMAIVRMSSWATCGSRDAKDEAGVGSAETENNLTKSGDDKLSGVSEAHETKVSQSYMEGERQSTCMEWKGTEPGNLIKRIGRDEKVQDDLMTDGGRSSHGDDLFLRGRDRGKSSEEEASEHPVEQQSIVSTLGLSVPDREMIGFKCKRVLDMGRLLYLRNHRLKTELVYYVERSITPENALLVAT